MRTSLSHRCARFLDARDMLRRAFPFAHAQMIPICAGMAAGQDRPWDAGRLYACRDLIQEKTGLFSNFRGAGHLAMITLLALSPARFCGRAFTPPRTSLWPPGCGQIGRGEGTWMGWPPGRRRFTGG